MLKRTQAITIDVPMDGRLRSAICCVSQAPPPPSGWPLVLAFHGGQSHPEFMRRFSGLDDLAEENRALVVYPAGTGTRESLLTWNGGNCCGEAFQEKSDDVGFIRRLLAAVAERFPIDSLRVHATGISNGAMMAYRVGAEMADAIASIAPVAGPLGLATIRPVRPVSVLHFHGTLDQFTPLEGGVGRRSVTRVHHRPIREGLLDWVQANGCSPECDSEVIPCSDEGITIMRYSWQQRAGQAPALDGSEVVFYRLQGGGHTWPGRPSELFLLGPSAVSLDANKILWDFFEKHPKPAPRATALG